MNTTTKIAVVCALIVGFVARSLFFIVQLQNMMIANAALRNQIESLEQQQNTYRESHSYSDTEYFEAMFTFYYVKPHDQKFGVYNLASDIEGLKWLKPYKEGVFDCSEMSAYLEWYLENEGWHSVIVTGDSPLGSGQHAWLLVETSTDHYMPVEATSLEVVWWENPYFDNYFKYDNRFDTIQEAWTFSKTEFDWWD